MATQGLNGEFRDRVGPHRGWCERTMKDMAEEQEPEERQEPEEGQEPEEVYRLFPPTLPIRGLSTSWNAVLT